MKHMVQRHRPILKNHLLLYIWRYILWQGGIQNTFLRLFSVAVLYCIMHPFLINCTVIDLFEKKYSVYLNNEKYQIRNICLGEITLMTNSLSIGHRPVINGDIVNEVRRF